MYCNLSRCHLAIFRLCPMISLTSLLVYRKRNVTRRLSPDLRNLFVNITRFVIPYVLCRMYWKLPSGVPICSLGYQVCHSKLILGFEKQPQTRTSLSATISLPRLLNQLNSREDVEQFISCRKHESLSLHHVIQGLRTSDCDWLAPSGISQKYRMCVSDAKKRKELLEDFVFWYFDGFVSPLLKVSGPRNEI